MKCWPGGTSKIVPTLALGALLFVGVFVELDTNLKLMTQVSYK